MKAIFCDRCYDLVLLVREERRCRCGTCSGKHVDETDTETNGMGVLVSIRTGILDLTSVGTSLVDKSENHGDIKKRLGEVRLPTEEEAKDLFERGAELAKGRRQNQTHSKCTDCPCVVFGGRGPRSLVNDCAGQERTEK